MPESSDIERIQAYLRNSARANYHVVYLPPFSIFFHPDDNLKYFNYAIPDEACAENLSETLADLRQAFYQRARTPRFEFFEAFAPELPAALREHGFIEEGRQWSMLCTPETFCPAVSLEKLEITALGEGSTPQDAHDLITIEREGFGSQENEEISDADIQKTLTRLKRANSHTFLGRIDSQAAGMAMCTNPIDSISEIIGIATRPNFRRRGIATYLTTLAVQNAFQHGALTACLTAEDERAGRVYQRVGFKPFSVMLAYIDSSG